MCLSSKTTEPPEAMIVAPPSPDQASVFSMSLQQIDNLPTENSVGNIKNFVGN